MEAESAQPIIIEVKVETHDGSVSETIETEVESPVKVEEDTKTPQESSTTVNTIIGEDEEGEAIDMADIKVLEDLDTENKSPEKEETFTIKTEKEDIEENKDSMIQKRKSYEFFYPDMVSTLELALRGLPGMANYNQSKMISHKNEVPKPMGSAQKRAPPIRDFAKEAKKALRKSGNIIEVKGTRKSTRNAENPVKPVYCAPKQEVEEISPEPVTKKPRNSPKSAGKKTKVLPQAQPKVTVIPQAIVKHNKATTKEKKKTPAKVQDVVLVSDNLPKPNEVSVKSNLQEELVVSLPSDQQSKLKYHVSNSSFRLSARSREWRKKAPVSRSRAKGSKLIVDNQKEIPTMMMKMRVSDTSDIVTKLDLAPPTKKLMMLKETEGNKVFMVPGRNLTPNLAWSLFYPNLMTKPRGDDSDDDDDDVLGEDLPAEEEGHGGQKKCFTIIRSEPLDMSDSEENIHYTNVLSDEDDDNAGPVYEETTSNQPVNTVSTATVVVNTPSIVKEETETDPIPTTSSGQVQEIKVENVTSQTLPVTRNESLLVQGEVTSIVPTHLVANNSVAENLASTDTSVVDISLTSVGAGQTITAGQTMTNTVIANQPIMVAQPAEIVTSSGTTEEGCVFVSVVTDMSEPYVEQGAEIMLQTTDSSSNPAGENYILLVEK